MILSDCRHSRALVSKLVLSHRLLPCPRRGGISAGAVGKVGRVDDRYFCYCRRELTRIIGYEPVSADADSGGEVGGVGCPEPVSAGQGGGLHGVAMDGLVWAPVVADLAASIAAWCPAASRQCWPCGDLLRLTYAIDQRAPGRCPPRSVGIFFVVEECLQQRCLNRTGTYVVHAKAITGVVDSVGASPPRNAKN
jgi:hypothetical protein